MWALDRLVRFGRVLFHGAKSTHATVTYESNSQIIRVDVSETFRHENRVPGHYYFVYAPSSLRGYESHPFTLCSWPTEPNKLADGNVSKEQTSGQVDSTEVKEQKMNHTLLLRPFAGFTRRLRDKVNASNNSSALEGQANSAKLTILLEGPYGILRQLHIYSDVLFIAGGSGITPAISYTHALLSGTSPGNPPSIHIVWALRQPALADSICANELAALRGHPNLKIDVYLTADQASLGKGKEPAIGDTILPYTTHFGRPDIESCVRQARAECKGALAVAFCGPRGMSDECRKAVVRVVKEKGPDVGLFNETLTW